MNERINITKKSFFKIGDIIILVLAIGIIVISYFFSIPVINGQKQVRIDTIDESYLYTLEGEGEVELSVKGPVGLTDIVIENNTVRVDHSDCLNKVCINSGRISRSGSWIACLPNQVFISIEGKKELEIDSISY